MSRCKFWTTRELAIVREQYPVGGMNACLALLPGRTNTAIFQQARKLGLSSPRETGSVRQHWPRDPHIDEQIRFAHQQAPKKGDIAKLAARIKRPVWFVSKRARELGLVTPRFREAPWSSAELAIAERTAELSPEATQRALARAGFKRTITACIVKRKRLGICMPKPEGVYRTGELADLLGYERSTTIRWIRLGMLEATTVAGSDERTVTDAQLRRFITRHPLQVDLRRLPPNNRPWFVELLTGCPPMHVGEAIAA